MSNQERQIARFGIYEADLRHRILTKGGLRIRLQDQPFQILVLLLERAGEIVSRDEIRQALWSADTFVEFDSGLNTAIKKLRTALGDTAENPRFIETIPRRGYRFVAPVSLLRVSPPDGSTQSPNEEGSPPTDPVSREVPPAPTMKTVVWSGRFRIAAILLLAGAGVFLYRASFGRLGSTGRAAAPDPALHPRVSVAVLGFNNLSRRPEQAWLSPALSEMLASELSAGEEIRTIPGENVTQTKRDLSLPDSDSYGNDTLLRIRQNLGADFVVLGSYFDLGKVSGGTVRLDLRMQDARTGELVASISKAGTEADLPALASLAGTDLRRRLGVAALSRAQAANVTAAEPSSPEAAESYSDGLAKLRTFDSVAAQASLEKSVQIEPNFALAHAALSDALMSLGYEAKAREESEKAFDLSNGLSREQRLWVEGHYHEAIRDRDKAIETYRELVHLFPDNIEYALRLAAVQDSADKGRDELTTLSQLRKLAPSMADDARLDLAEANAAVSTGDYPRAEAADARAAEKARVIGAQLLLANARHHQCWALNRLGQVQAALAACQESQQIFAKAGDRDSVASLLVTSGAVFSEQGQSADARARYEEALRIYQLTGDQGGVTVALNNLAIVNRKNGDYRIAEDKYQKSISIARKTGDQHSLVLGLGNLAALSVYQNNLPRARELYEELLAICQKLGSKDRIALQLGNLGDVLFFQGDLAAAQQNLQDSVALDFESGEQRQLGYHYASMGDVFEAEGRLSEAREKRQEALKIRTAIADKNELCNSRIALAESSIEEGHPREAVEPLRQAIAELKQLQSEDDEAAAYPLLAQAFLLQDSPADAQRVIESGAAVNARSHNGIVKLGYSIAAAQVRAANGGVVSAVDRLTRIIAETKKSGFYGYQLQARLALAEIETKSRKSGANAQVRALEEEARKHGFLLIAKKASTLSVRGRGVVPTHTT